MKKILAQAMKEFRLFRRDKLLILLAVLMPIVLMYLAGTTASLRLRNVPLLVYDYDNTALSRSYLETYGAALTFKLTPREPNESPEQALSSWRGRAALIIPQNFERDARRGAEPVVQLLIDLRLQLVNHGHRLGRVVRIGLAVYMQRSHGVLHLEA